MRIWSLDPAYLDPAGLVALWRESLLAQRVLQGGTRGYTRHPQLERFRATSDAIATIGAYLAAVAEEADRRGYRFDRTRIEIPGPAEPLDVSTGQLDYEASHLRAKLLERAPHLVEVLDAGEVRCHPLFTAVPGPIAPWERTSR